MLVCPLVLAKQMETGKRFVLVCVWHVIWRWQMVLVTASAVANRLPRRHCSQGLFWWGGAPKGDRITTHSSPSHVSAKSPPSFPHFLSLSRLSISFMKYNKHSPWLYSRTHSCACTRINTQIFLLVPALPLKDTHFSCHTPQRLCICFLCTERVLTDVEAVVWRRHGVEKGLGWGEYLPPTARSTTLIDLQTDNSCNKRERKAGTNFLKWGQEVSLEVRFDERLLFSLMCRLHFETGPACMKTLSQLELF